MQSEDREEQIHGLCMCVCMCVYVCVHVCVHACVGKEIVGVKGVRVLSPRTHICGDSEISLILSLLLARSLLT